MSRLKGFLIGLILLYVAWRAIRLWSVRIPTDRRGLDGFWLRELGVLALSSVLLVVFLVVGALWHRPMRSLTGVAPGDLVV
ncbi:MAG TPA: hypothetical protein VGC48_00615, partial [Gemmatimonadales bacterium]